MLQAIKTQINLIIILKQFAKIVEYLRDQLIT